MDTDSDEGFLDAIHEDDQAETLELTVEAPAEVEVEVKPAEVEPEAEVEAKEPEAKPEPQTAPISALLDERDKRKALEAELAQYRASQQQQQPKTQAPDMFEDPEGYTAYQTEQMEKKVYQQSLNMSHRFAVQQHGEELTNEAVEWAKAKCSGDLYFDQQVRASGDPVGYAVSQYQRDKIASSVTPTDFEQFQAWKAAQTGLAAEQTETTAAKTLPPRSLASAPSAGGVMTEVAQTEDEIFAETFARK